MDFMELEQIPEHTASTLSSLEVQKAGDSVTALLKHIQKLLKPSLTISEASGWLRLMGNNKK